MLCPILIRFSISNFDIKHYLSNRYIDAANKLFLYAAFVVVHSHLIANIGKFQTLVTLYFSSVFNILTRLQNNRSGCMMLLFRNVTVKNEEMVAFLKTACFRILTNSRYP